MYAERRKASDEQVAVWLERVSARMRELEQENAQLKQQLADLRRGVGLTVMIEGNLVPLAPQEQPRRPTTSSQPVVTAPDPLNSVPHARLVPVPRSANPRHTFGPLATTPDELPAVRGLLPAPRQPANDWLSSGEAWPESAAQPHRRDVARTLGHVPPPVGSSGPPAHNRYSAGRHIPTSDPLWRERAHPQNERSPYADSFML